MENGQTALHEIGCMLPKISKSKTIPCSVFLGLFLSGCFFPPNDRVQDHAQENPLLSELFGPGHFVGLGLRLKSKIRTRTRAWT
jgi:hypothetical protein